MFAGKRCLHEELTTRSRVRHTDVRCKSPLHALQLVVFPQRDFVVSEMKLHSKFAALVVDATILCLSTSPQCGVFDIHENDIRRRSLSHVTLMNAAMTRSG